MLSVPNKPFMFSVVKLNVVVLNVVAPFMHFMLNNNCNSCSDQEN
jgi:hypothetical protein